MAALRTFGAPLANLTVEDLTTPGTVFQIGVAPSRVRVPVLGRDDFIANKRASGRARDLADIEGLE